MQTSDKDVWAVAANLNTQTVLDLSGSDREAILQFSFGKSKLFFMGRVELRNPELIAQKLGVPLTTNVVDLFCRGYAAGMPYEEWLYGELGFALYDASKNTLLLGRDPLGLESIYYFRKSNLYVVSNSLDLLLAQEGIELSINDATAASWCINGSVTDVHASFFNEISKCPPATILKITSSGINEKKYWRSTNARPLIYKDEQEYSHHLRSLIESVIEERVDPHIPSGAHLSGGLDSSAIAIIAGRKVKSFDQHFYTFNWCKPSIEHDSDSHEWSNARLVSNSENFIHQETGITSATLKHLLLNHDIARDGTAMFYYEHEVLKQAQASGIKTIFSGFGGDEGITSRSRDRHYEKIRSGQFLLGLKHLALEMAPHQRVLDTRLARAYSSLVFRSFFPDQNSRVQRAYQVKLKQQGRLDLLTPEFAELAINQWNDCFRLYLESESIHERQQILLNSGYHQERMESWSIAGGRRGIRYEYPYLDQRIIEFALAIPSDLYFRHGRPRHLYINSLKELLPASIQKQAKLTESYRVTHLMEQLQVALSDNEVIERTSSTDSPYINTRKLIQKILELQNLDRDQLLQHSSDFLDAANAVHTLNINGGLKK